ncbi:methionine synthase II (cobalamin-independent) [Nocardioides massiliensis]|uniref:Methionine synthase II (Cobalamin-independent) n=1 Tax=Nocardioides massiliensis TaxID=1325935 RepID=A0ABT9NJC6_9ACTN|nr:methionine synthase II (cobalamin-independent) [Nocardioides massiliensis]
MGVAVKRFVTCPGSGKKCLPDVETAIRKALRYSAQRGTPLRYYRCPDCGLFHLTKRPLSRAHVDTYQRSA